MLEMRTGIWGYSAHTDPYAIGASDITGLIPVYAKLSHGVSETDGGTFLYKKPKERQEAMFVGKKPLVKILREEYVLYPYAYKVDGVEQMVYGLRGYLEDEDGDVLMALCETSPTEAGRGERELDTKKLRLFMAMELATKPMYKPLYRKVHDVAMMPCLNSGVPVEFTASKDLGRRLFDCGMYLRFATLEEMDVHLKTVPGNLLPW